MQTVITPRVRHRLDTPSALNGGVTHRLVSDPAHEVARLLVTDAAPTQWANPVIERETGLGL